jgi:hypothetical protein
MIDDGGGLPRVMKAWRKGIGELEMDMVWKNMMSIALAHSQEHLFVVF